MMTASSAPGAEMPAGGVPLGLFELDAEGTILYYRVERGAEGAAAQLVGHNLFTELECAENAREFRRIVHDFAAGREPARSFDFTFLLGPRPYRVRVLMARTREQTEGGERELSLVHIRNAC